MEKSFMCEETTQQYKDQLSLELLTLQYSEEKADWKHDGTTMPPLMYIFISLFIILTSFKYSHKFSHKFSHKYSDKSKINIAKHDHISSAVQVGGGAGVG